MKNQFFLRGDIKWKNGMKCLVELQSNMELIRNRCTSRNPETYYKKLNKCILFVNLTHKLPFYYESKETYIRFFVMFLDENILKTSIEYGDYVIYKTLDWELNRKIKNEYRLIYLAGVPAFFDEGFIIDIDNDGFCRYCGNDIKTYNEFCNSECDNAYGLDEGFKTKCYICQQVFSNKDLVKHHTCYATDSTIRICRSCHSKVHHSKSADHIKFKNTDFRPKSVSKRVYVKCDICQGKTYKPSEIDILVDGVSCKKTVCVACSQKQIKHIKGNGIKSESHSRNYKPRFTDRDLKYNKRLFY
jgi:hypothetical protein